jgi:molybdopterin synthase catalytic subunit
MVVRKAMSYMSDATLTVRVLYFATLRDLAGVREEQLTLPEGAIVAELKQTVVHRHEKLELAMDSAIVAVNREFAFPEQSLLNGDEVALFPPVSGGLGMEYPTLLQVIETPLDLNKALEAITLPTTGAACVFTGMVRAKTEREGGQETSYLEYEAYAPMALEKMKLVAEEIRERWASVEGIAIIQRIGHLEPGTATVLIGCSAGHRDSGVFEAARYGIDRLKQIVPIWKKEVGPAGEVWIEGEYRPSEKDLTT